MSTPESEEPQVSELQEVVDDARREMRGIKSTIEEMHGIFGNLFRKLGIRPDESTRSFSEGFCSVFDLFPDDALVRKRRAHRKMSPGERLDKALASVEQALKSVIKGR